MGGKIADVVFHDLAGWLMMPLALTLLWVELRVLGLVLVDQEPDALPVLGAGVSARPRPHLETVQAAGAKVVSFF